MTSAEENNHHDASPQSEPELSDLFLFRSGGRAFGIPAEDVEGIAEATPPAPLPHAPKTILGVVYVRGRMLTVLDPVGIASAEQPTPNPVKVIISLRSDEQLALAAESVLETITISASDIELVAAANAEATAIAGSLLHGGEKVAIFDPAKLFDSAVHRKDRRRRRF